MNISVTPAYFTRRWEALEDIRELGMHPVEMQVPPVSNKSHWHSFSTRIYIVEGELHITDSASKRVLNAGPGALVEVPERVLHSEESDCGYAIIAGMSVDPAALTGPIDLEPGLL